MQVLKSSDVLSLAAKRPRRLRLRPQFGKCQTLQLLTRNYTRLARPLAADTGTGRPSSAGVGGHKSGHDGRRLGNATTTGGAGPEPM